MKFEVDVLGLPSLIVLMISGHKATLHWLIAELRRCVRVEVAVMGSPSITVLMVSVDVKQHLKKKKIRTGLVRFPASAVFP